MNESNSTRVRISFRYLHSRYMVFLFNLHYNRTIMICTTREQFHLVRLKIWYLSSQILFVLFISLVKTVNTNQWRNTVTIIIILLLLSILLSSLLASFLYPFWGFVLTCSKHSKHQKGNNTSYLNSIWYEFGIPHYPVRPNNCYLIEILKTQFLPHGLRTYWYWFRW